MIKRFRMTSNNPEKYGNYCLVLAETKTEVSKENKPLYQIVSWLHTPDWTPITTMYKIFESYHFPDHILAEVSITENDDGTETYEIPEKYGEECLKFWKRVGFFDTNDETLTKDEQMWLSKNLTAAGCFLYRNNIKEYMVLGIDLSLLIYPIIVRLFRDGCMFTLYNPQKLLESLRDFYRRHYEHFENLKKRAIIDLEAQLTVTFVDYVKKKCAEDE